MKEYRREFTIIWANLDPNRHMRHSAYNDYAAQVRLEYFTEKGLSLKTLNELGVGPILFREETKFFREVHMNETITATLQISKVRKDGSKWSILHNIYNQTGDLACQILCDGAWLDLEVRKVAVPPIQIAEMLVNAPRTEDFEWVPDKK
jgi:acyl-CoA thioester hydrolase